jgi:hypothetical protein
MAKTTQWESDLKVMILCIKGYKGILPWAFLDSLLIFKNELKLLFLKIR